MLGSEPEEIILLSAEFHELRVDELEPVDLDFMRSDRDSRERTSITYLRHAVSEFCNVLPPLVLGLYAALHGAVLVLLVGLAAHLLVLVGVSRLPSFRRAVDDKMERADRALAAEVRTRLLGRMSDEHREGLHGIEQRVDRIRSRLRECGAEHIRFLDDQVGLRRLTMLYAQLAIIHRSASRGLSSVEHTTLIADIAMLEEICERRSDEHSHELTRGRIQIARCRLARWERTRGEVDSIAQMMATIEELVALFDEQSAAPPSLRAAQTQLDRLVGSLSENGAVLRQLTELGARGDELALLDRGRISAILLPQSSALRGT